MSNCLYKGIKLQANAKNLRKVKCKHHYSIKKLNVTLFLPAINKFLLLVKPLLKFGTGLDNLSEILIAGY